MKTKLELRKTWRNKLSGFSSEFINASSREISKNLLKLFEELNVDPQTFIIGVFAPIQKEPEWDLLIDETKFKTAYPAYSEGRMIFKIARMSELKVSQDFGVKILGPELDAEIVAPDIIIVPGLGFTREGKRLGRGKGFYDRYLEKTLALKIGIAFDLQIEKDIPTDVHDVLMDFVVTDKGIYKKS